MKNRVRRKKQSGGNLDSNQTLMLADTYHDFWECNRGQFAGPDAKRLRALLNFGILRETYNLLVSQGVAAAVLDPHIPATPYIPQVYGSKTVAEYSNLSDAADFIFKSLSNNTIDSMSNIEEQTVAYLGIPGPTGTVELEEIHLKEGNKEIYTAIITAALGNNYKSDESVHILCDTGFGNMGKVGNFEGTNLRGLITPQVIGDSANTSTTIIGRNPNIYYAPSGGDGATSENEFISDSNLFTTNEYAVGYLNKGLNDNNPYNFSLFIKNKITGEEYNCDFSPNTNTGPSAGLLGGCFIADFFNKAAQANPENPSIVYNEQKIREGLSKQLTGKPGTGKMRATSNVVDIWNALGNKGLNPAIFLDLKRGGDRDQVMAAKIASEHFNNVIFCTIDKLCAATAIGAGLPTILQAPAKKNPPTKASITVWAAGAAGAQQGGAMNTLLKYTGGALNVNDNTIEVVTAADLIRDIASQAADFVKTAISKGYPLINIYSQVDIILNEFTKIQTMTSINPQSLTPLNTAIGTLSILTGTTHPLVLDPSGLVDAHTYYTQLKNTLFGQLNTPEQLGIQTKLRIAILTSSGAFTDACKDIYTYLIDKYDKKFGSGTLGNTIFQNFKLYLEPYNDSGDIKGGYFGTEPVVRSAMATYPKDLYAVALIALTLLDDMINDSINRRTSVATNILYGTSYPLINVPSLNEVTAESYNNSFTTIMRSLLMYNTQTGTILVPKEVYGLLHGGKRKHKTLKRSKNIRRRKHMKTQHKRK